jgi:hypothetical protein
VPLAAMYGLDPSKSQPFHFLITFLIGVVCAAVVVSISWNAAKRRLADFSKTSLAIGDGKLILMSGMGQSDLDLGAVTSVIVRQNRNTVRSVVLKFSDGRRVELQGYSEMNALLSTLRQHLSQDLFES